MGNNFRVADSTLQNLTSDYITIKGYQVNSQQHSVISVFFAPESHTKNITEFKRIATILLNGFK